MAEWIPVSPEVLPPAKNTDPTEKGVEFELFVSPFDVPDAVRGHYDKALDKFIIELKYIGDESKQLEKKVGDHILFRTGANSGRLYAIILVDVKLLKVGQVGLKIMSKKNIAEVLSKYAKSGAKPQRRENYELAQKVIDEHDEIFGELANVSNA